MKLEPRSDSIATKALVEKWRQFFTPDPGVHATNEEKIEFYFKYAGVYIHKKCGNYALRVPLEVVKRGIQNVGVNEVYFSNEQHAREFLHNMYRVEKDGDIETMVEEAFGTKNGVECSVKLGEPSVIVWKHATWEDLVEECYNSGKVLEAAFEFRPGR